jgi:hypothetical protein
MRDEVQRQFVRSAYAAEAPKGIFRDGCLGAAYAIDGRLVSGPAPTDLNRYAVEQRDVGVRVDMSRRVAGAPREPAHPAGTPTPAATVPRP